MSVGKKVMYERLDRGPCFLLLGQRYLSLETGSDPLAGPLARAVGAEELSGGVYKSLLGIEPGLRPDAFKALTHAGRTLVLPPPIRTTLDFPWNGVVSSAVDPAWRAGLEREWRTVQQTIPQRDRTRISRSIQDVQALMLFGGVDQPGDDQPPATRPELTRRRAIAADALGRVVTDALTPRGILVIEGWGLDDWLNPETLFAQIYESVPGQVHLFSATEQILADDHIQEAVDLQILVPHEESFASVVVEAQGTGRLREQRPATTGTHALRVGDRLLTVDRGRWQRVLPHARPIDLDLLDDPPAESDDRRYQKFREFLGTSDASPAWWAHARGLPFQRNFEYRLWERAEQAAVSREQRGPLVVAGQSGTGKSVALARLAFQMARSGRRAVLHIPRRSTRPDFEALDDFCLWAEEQAGGSTLIVWDGMAEPQEYQRLFDYLRSRGRKVVVVGSCYWDEHLFGTPPGRRTAARAKRTAKKTTPRPRYRRGQDFIEATATLAGKELQRFIKYLGEFGIRLKPGDEQLIAADNSFLSALYHLLPEAHDPIASGLTLELRHSQQRLSHAARTRMDFDANTSMAHALVKAGVLNGLEIALKPSGAEPVTAEDDPYERLLSLVLLVHSHGLRIPLELALRTIGRDGVRNLPDLLSGIDIIRWDEDDVGNYTLGGRNQLEARLLTRARASGREREAAQIAEVLEFVRPEAGARRGGPEIDFALDLLTRIGPQVDRDQKLYGAHYLAFADAVAELRTHVYDPVVHARLVQKEVNLRREWAVRDQRREGSDPEARLDALDAAQDAVDEALRNADDLRRRPDIMLNLYVEQASVRGSRLYEQLYAGPGRVSDSPPSEEHLADELRDIQRSVQNALACDGTTYYPVDVLCWVCRDTLKAGVLSEKAAAALLGDCLSALTAIDPESLEPRQAALYHSRFEDIASWAGDRVMAEQQLKKLEAYDEPLAAFFYAIKVSGFLKNDPQPDGVRDALAHLREQPSRLQDERCIRIALDLLWFARTNERFMAGERQTLPLDGAAWQECLDLTELARTYDATASLRVLFMRALALFHLGKLDNALEAFRELDRLSQEQHDRRRVINVYTASTPDGTPRRFRARVLRVDADFRGGRCWIEEYQREFSFYPDHFGSDQAVVGRTFDAFVVFNMRGPWLEPPREPGERRGPTLLGPAGERHRETKGAM